MYIIGLMAEDFNDVLRRLIRQVLLHQADDEHTTKDKYQRDGRHLAAQLQLSLCLVGAQDLTEERKYKERCLLFSVLEAPDRILKKLCHSWVQT